MKTKDHFNKNTRSKPATNKNTAQNIETMRDQLTAIDEHIAQNTSWFKRIKERIDKAKAREIVLDGLIEQSREERQTILAQGDDHKDLTLKIKEGEEEAEMLKEEIAGLEKSIQYFELEKVSLENQRLTLQKEAIKEEIIRPLVSQYNKLALKLAENLTALEEAIFDYNIISIPGIENRMPVYPSGNYDARGWENNALSVIPSLFVLGDAASQVIYDRKKVIDRLKGEIYKAREKKRIERERQDEERRIRLKEELEERFKNADCFKCLHYMGIPSGDALMCESFFRIPTEILEGTVSHRFKKIEDERFLFEEKVASFAG